MAGLPSHAAQFPDRTDTTEDVATQRPADRRTSR